MPVLARLQPLSTFPDERRRAPRLLLKLGAKLGSGPTAVVHDLSTRGLLFETAEALGAERIHVHLPEVQPASARVVWTHGRFYGCEFDEPIPTASVSAALLRSEPMPPVLASAERNDEPAGAPLHGGWAAEAAAGAVMLAVVGWLAVTGHFIALAAIGVGALILFALLVATALWAMDNSSDLNL